jgi:polyhydroxyalkanoate synthesis repressor PhaR
MLVKKYGNRRLYDTDSSRYITLEELADAIRHGKDVQVVDAKSNADLTQATLAQIILESRGASRLLPTPLLVQLIRMGDDALAEFFQRYVGWALQVYVQMKQNAQALSAFNPFGGFGFGGAGPFGGLFAGAPAPPAPQTAYEPAPEPEEREPEAPRSDVAELRKELEELKDLLRAQAKRK